MKGVIHNPFSFQWILKKTNVVTNGKSNLQVFRFKWILLAKFQNGGWRKNQGISGRTPKKPQAGSDLTWDPSSWHFSSTTSLGTSSPAGIFPG
jgi:hypothetical protein